MPAPKAHDASPLDCCTWLIVKAGGVGGMFVLSSFLIGRFALQCYKLGKKRTT